MTSDHTARTERLLHGGVSADPGRLAPHLDKTWRDDFIIELRLAGVAGDVIGDALVTADTHIQESGESAQEAFGDARIYAREIAESSGADPAWTLSPAEVLGSVAGLVGMLATVAAFTAWLDGGPVTVTVGGVAGFVVLLGLVTLLVLRPARMVRVLVDHRMVVSILAPILLIGCFVALLLLLPRPILDLGAAPLGLFGVLLLTASCVLAWRQADAGAQVEITEPGSAPRSGASARLTSVLVFPAMTALLLVFTWILSLIA